LKIRDKYRDLSNEELLDKAYQLGFNYEKHAHSCSQSTVAAIYELVEMDDVVVKVSTSLCGGSASQMLGSCGALAGGIIALDYFFGRPVEKMSPADPTKADTAPIGEAGKRADILAEKFIKRYGTFICCQIQRQLLGRIFWPKDEQEMAKLVASGAHDDPDKCCDVVGNASRWTLEILLDEFGRTK
jgi:C_GCAxxG_C_C family probable redox protein